MTDGDWLGDKMRDAPYFEDDGFTARVMAKLPAPRQKRRRRRGAVVFGSATAGVLLALFVLPGGATITGEIARLLNERQPTPLPFATLTLIGFIIAGTAWSLHESKRGYR
ncbi:MAG: hypothetical protein AAFU77_15785 [Myxococcota bacterium]